LSAGVVAGPHGRLWEVELDLRVTKAAMGLGQLEVNPADLAQKEFYAGLMACNLVRGPMDSGAASVRFYRLAAEPAAATAAATTTTRAAPTALPSSPAATLAGVNPSTFSIVRKRLPKGGMSCGGAPVRRRHPSSNCASPWRLPCRRAGTVSVQ